jgi:hypothetical protein
MPSPVVIRVTHCANAAITASYFAILDTRCVKQYLQKVSLDNELSFSLTTVVLRRSQLHLKFDTSQCVIRSLSSDLPPWPLALP